MADPERSEGRRTPSPAPNPPKADLILSPDTKSVGTKDLLEMDKSDFWHVYIIECKDKKLYVGIAKDLDKRIELHIYEI